ncbi:hypothetical protein A0U40_16000 [[Bacillus] sp. KCTC 13219]|nr:hypothetical protein A0U40_16000 [[Bacillus] sp. KCTC 13219]
MHPKMKIQNEGTAHVAKSFVENIPMDEHAGLIIALTREKWLNNHLDQLEAEQKQLEEELKQIVLSYSARIQLIKELIGFEARECGRQESLIDICEERGIQVNEKATIDTARKANR